MVEWSLKNNYFVFGLNEWTKINNKQFMSMNKVYCIFTMSSSIKK